MLDLSSGILPTTTTRTPPDSSLRLLWGCGFIRLKCAGNHLFREIHLSWGFLGCCSSKGPPLTSPHIDPSSPLNSKQELLVPSSGCVAQLGRPPRQRPPGRREIEPTRARGSTQLFVARNLDSSCRSVPPTCCMVNLNPGAGDPRQEPTFRPVLV